MDKFTKQPYEEFTISSDFGLNFLSGETIVSQTVSAVDSSNVDVTATITTQASVAHDGSKVTVLVKGGTTGNTYKITFRCVTSLGHKWENDVQMKVTEI